MHTSLPAALAWHILKQLQTISMFELTAEKLLCSGEAGELKAGKVQQSLPTTAPE